MRAGILPHRDPRFKPLAFAPNDGCSQVGDIERATVATQGPYTCKEPTNSVPVRFDFGLRIRVKGLGLNRTYQKRAYRLPNSVLGLWTWCDKGSIFPALQSPGPRLRGLKLHRTITCIHISKFINIYM